MCAIAGFWGGGLSKSYAIEILNNMNQAMIHRGPDDKGVFYDKDSHIGLSHRRLSILDLSKAGKQPMESNNKRFILIYNGEIYNHLQLRKVIEKSSNNKQWLGSSDTETLLAGFEILGIQTTLQQAVGMFAFALWDKKKKILTLGRDRIGEKPLYYGQLNDVFIFASELAAIECYPNFKKQINKEAVSLMLRYNHIPAPASIYQNIFKLEPGILLTIDSKHRQTTKQFWSIKQNITNNLHQFDGSFAQASNTLEDLLTQSVTEKMLSDVPVGALLSGGIDSSLIVALMQKQSTKPIKTFSIGNYNKSYNEAIYAKKVAKHIGCEHTELYIDKNTLLDIIPKLSQIYNEPFADSSQIPTYLVSSLAKSKVSVALSGDGGDELFAGYNRYTTSNVLWHKLNKIPLPIRKILSKLTNHISINTLEKIAQYAIFSKHGISSGEKLYKSFQSLTSNSIEELYLNLSSNELNPNSFVLGTSSSTNHLIKDKYLSNKLSDIEKMMLFDILSYLPNDILTKVDRASMAVSLEMRVPFLDHRVIDFAWQLPLSYKLQGQEGKLILKDILYKYVPKSLIERPKMGFSIPIGDYLRTNLRDWAQSLLDEQLLKQQGYFNAKQVTNLWHAHLSGKFNFQHKLWSILMFQSWLNER